MAAPSLLLDFAVVLIAAEIGGVLFGYLKLPRVVGMLVAGIILGPFTPGYIVDLAGIEDLALLGAVFLMFSVGLSFDIRTFRRLGAAPFILAGMGVGISLVFGIALGIAVGWALLPSLFLGLILTSTSTTIGLKLLQDFGLTNSPGADLVTAAILVDDIISLSLMTVAVGLASPTPVPSSTIIAGLAAIIALVALLVFVGQRALPSILKVTDELSPGSTVTVAVSFALLLSFAFAVFGLPPLVGAFFAGSIVASTEYGSRVIKHIRPVSAIFMGVFFTSIGFLINPGMLPAIALMAVAVVPIAIAAKILPGFMMLRRVKSLPRKDVWWLAAVLIPRAEVSLIIAQYGVSIGIGAELLALTMAVVIATAILPAPIARVAKRLGKQSRVPEAA